MKAIVNTRYGPPEVLQLKEVEKPQPKDHELLVRIVATAVNSGDWRLRKAEPYAVRFFFGLRKPRISILGGVFSGEIEAVGKDVTLFNVGKPVFGSTGMRFGAYAQYICLPENSAIALKPDILSHKEAAVIPFGASTALHFLRKANIKAGQNVLIYGASGSVGTAAVQLAKYYGANVTAVCSTTNLEMVNSIGADKVIDYTKTDFTKSTEIYDVIMCTTNKLSFSQSIKSLHKKGTLILSDAGMREILKGIWTSISSSQNVLTGVISQDAGTMQFLKELIDNGKLKPVIDRTYSLEHMAEAHAYVELGHKKGNVAVTVH